MGLQQSYRDDRGTHDFIRRVMALPFLPEDEIVPQFERLESQVTEEGNLRQFIQYVRSTWIEGSTWKPLTWTVFLQSVRTNNDVEGWHHGLHRRASSRSQLPLYILINLLHREARLTSLHIRLVSEKKLKRVQRRKYRKQQAKIFSLWDEYCSGDKNARQLLRACSYINGPSF